MYDAKFVQFYVQSNDKPTSRQRQAHSLHARNKSKQRRSTIKHCGQKTTDTSSFSNIDHKDTSTETTIRPSNKTTPGKKKNNENKDIYSQMTLCA